MQSQPNSTPLAIIVDDDADIRQFVGRVAVEAGFAIEMAASGAELLSILGDRNPAVIVLDLNMSNADGVEAMRELAARRLTSKIVIFSGSDMRILESAGEIARQRGLTIGATLQKPVRRAELLKVLSQLKLESEVLSAAMLRTCIDQKLMSLHFQPKISLASFKVVGAEALLRCTDPAGRQIPPEALITVAETADMIDEVTEWVFREALAQRRRWAEQGNELEMAINLSPRSSFNQDLPELFAAICAENDAPVPDVTIELTETSAMNDKLLAMESLVRLRLKGFRLSIDDFGTGYSSLARLKQMPFNEIKVDRSFVTTIHTSRDNAVIVKAIIQLAQSLEMDSVIEGVEDQKALDIAAGLGCGDAQGYFIARPMPGSEMAGFLKSWQWRQQAARPAAVKTTAAPQAARDVSS